MKHNLVYRKGERYPYQCTICSDIWKQEPSKPCPGVTYYAWQQAPAHLQTYSQLRSKHLKPRDRAQPDGCIICKDEWCWLYDERQAKPRRICTDRQLQALEHARQCQHEKWKCEHCGYKPSSLTALRYYFAWPGLCKECKRDIARETRIYGDRLEAIEWARQIMTRDDWAILDTETTSLTGYPVEIAVIAPNGSTLFHSLVNPPVAVESGARAVHGISDEELANAPVLPYLWPDLQAALAGRSLLLAYGADFDSSVMDRAAHRYQLPELMQKWACLKLWYAQFCGDWSDYWHSYRWQPLDGGHRALEDARAALVVLHNMATATPDDK